MLVFNSHWDLLPTKPFVECLPTEVQTIMSIDLTITM